MSQRLPNGLAWTLLGLTVLLLAANVVLGLTGGVTWTASIRLHPGHALVRAGRRAHRGTGRQPPGLVLPGRGDGDGAQRGRQDVCGAHPGRRTARGGVGGLDPDRVPRGHGALLLPDPATVPGRPPAVAAVAAGGVDRRPRRAGRRRWPRRSPTSTSPPTSRISATRSCSSRRSGRSTTWRPPSGRWCSWPGRSPWSSASGGPARNNASSSSGSCTPRPSRPWSSSSPRSAPATRCPRSRSSCR